MTTPTVVSPPSYSSAYTPLESLLLFNHLAAHGADHSSFKRISEALLTNPSIREDPAFDSGRLNAEALSSFYLQLLKDEAKSEVRAANASPDEASHGNGVLGSRKRKAASPDLPKVQDGSQHASLMPQLVNKLYARYRSQQIQYIRDLEITYDQLVKDHKDIEAGLWNKRLEQEIAQGRWGHVLSRKELRNRQPENEQQESGSRPSGRKLNGPDHAATDEAVLRSHLPASAASSITSNAKRIPQTASATAAVNDNAKSSRVTTDDVREATSTQAEIPYPGGQQYSHIDAGPSSSSLEDRQASAGQNSRTPLPSTHIAQQTRLTTGMPYAQQAGGFVPQSGAASSAFPPQPFAAPQGQIHNPAASHSPRPGVRVGGVELTPWQFHPQGSANQPSQAQQSTIASQPKQNASPRAFRLPDGKVIELPPGMPVVKQSPTTGQILQNLDTVRTGVSRVTRWTEGSSAPAAPDVQHPGRAMSPLSPPPEGSSGPAQRTKATPGDRSIVEREHQQTRGKGTSRRGRGRSVASSTKTGSMRARTRSESIASQMSTESVPGRKVKPEPSTPAYMTDDVSATIEASPTNLRRRGGHSLLPMPRKRRLSVRGTSEPSEGSQDPLPSPTLPPTHVAVSRNFARTCNPILNDILSHRFASLFANPVKERDAPGYYDLILRPQDFKSVKAAISNGQRTVAAELAELAEAATPAGHNSPASGPTGHTKLPISADLMPPKSIVTSSQLEKEITRVFANAAMYNIGNDPVVQDARGMFEDVQKSVENWRAAERVQEVPAHARKEVRDTTDPEHEDEAAEAEGSVGAGKRRRLA